MAAYSIDDILDSTLTTQEDVNAHLLPTLTSKVYGMFKAGSDVGSVYSYVNKPDGLWWQFVDNKGVYYYIKHTQTRFDKELLKSQGTLSVQQKAEKAAAEAEANKGILDTIKDDTKSVIGVIKWVVIIGLILFVLFEINKRYPLAKLFKK